MARYVYGRRKNLRPKKKKPPDQRRGGRSLAPKRDVKGRRPVRAPS